MRRFWIAFVLLVATTSRLSGQQGPVSEDLVELYQTTQSMSSIDEFTQLIDQLKIAAVDNHRSLDDKKYARQLLSWALNRRGEVRSEAAAKHVESEDLEAAAKLDTQAASDFRASLKLDGQRWRARHNLAISLAMAGQYSSAIEQFSEVIKLKPDYANAYFNRGELFFQSDRFEQAVADFERAIEVNPQDPQYYNSCAHALFMNGKYEEAIDYYRKSTEIAPESVLWLTDLGDAMQYLGRWQDALDTYRKAIELDRTNASIYQSAAWLMATCPDKGIRNPTSALNAAKKAIEFGGEEPLYLDTLAAALAANGKYAEAKQTQQKALEKAEPAVRGEIQQRLALYEKRMAYVQPSAALPATSDPQPRISSNNSPVLPASTTEPVGTGAKQKNKTRR